MTEKMSNEEFDELKKKVYSYQIKYSNFIVPERISHAGNKDIYDLDVKCPFCHQIINYKNWFIPNKYYHHNKVFCKNCMMSFHVVSRLYKFTTRYYLELDFLRKTYLAIRDRFLKAKI
jgi:hypothetical protein